MKYDLSKAAILISVRELCSLSLIAGDLDNRSPHKAPWIEEAKSGREAHLLLQNRGEPGYQAEVPLTVFSMVDGIAYEVSGRADGVVMTPDKVIVEEIKTHSGRFVSMQPTLFQKTQALCYAHFLCTFHQIPQITVRLTVYNLETEEIKSQEEEYSAKFLAEYFRKLLLSISFLSKIEMERETIRKPSLKLGKFPFSSVREGQELMMKACFSAIKNKKQLFVQAPTGTGKTISTLYPAVRAIGAGYCEKIFYLTAKSSTRKEAFRAASDLYAAGAHQRTIVLTAKEQLCPNQTAKNDPCGLSAYCNPDFCPRASGFYDRLPLALKKLLTAKNGYPRKTIEDVANEYSLCPYEFQLELAKFCDIIICDYNCVFDPMVHLRRFFGESAENQDSNILLVDEAHNLADRACAMYSSELSSLDFINGFSEISSPHKKILSMLLNEIDGLRKLTRDSSEKDENGISHGFFLSKKAMDAWNATVKEAKRQIERKILFPNTEFVDSAWSILYRKLSKYETISENYDEKFLTFIEENGEEIKIRQICLDPSGVLSSVSKRQRASIFFSATLTPTEYFSDILGGGKNAKRLSLPSPFNPSKQLIGILKGVSTRFEDRKQSAKTIVSALGASISGKAGNYIAYFPSYEFMQSIAETFTKKYPQVPVIIQQKGMTPAKKDAFLDAFAEDSQLRLGFCVLGGSFSEGIDLPGKRLIGSIIVGVGLPGLSSERNILKEYYEQTREQGYDYAYTYPGMNRVLQAAGRVIRTENDCGIVILMDDRYETPAYQMLFPEHWQNVKYASNSLEIAETVKEFWKNQKNNGIIKI